MAAGTVCALHGCPTIIESREGERLLYCSETHLLIDAVDVLRRELRAATGSASDLPSLNAQNVSQPLGVRRSGSLK